MNKTPRTNAAIAEIFDSGHSMGPEIAPLVKIARQMEGELDALSENAEERCRRGIRRPHECKECADEPSKEDIAAFAEAELAEQRRELSDEEIEAIRARWCGTGGTYRELVDAFMRAAGGEG